MKSMLFAALMILSQASFAAIIGSDYDSRHQNVIEKAVKSDCGYLRDLTYVSSKQVVVHVDQGIRDVNFTTILTGVSRIDQGVFDNYKVIVKSNYADMYDHSTANWGAYSVESVQCIQE
jgi:hypothetical protein